jgi:mono/diheme cytochrome c family protein
MMDRFKIRGHVLSGIIILLSGACRADVSRASEPQIAVEQHPGGQASGAAPAGAPAARKLFGQFCSKCHGMDGTGKQARDDFPKIPNFADPAWHATRKDAQLLVSILHGKGHSMPAFRDRLGEVEARSLIAHVRAFAPKAENPPQQLPKGAGDHATVAADSFEARFRALEKELERLRDQVRALSQASASRDPRSKPGSSPTGVVPKPPSQR